MRRVLLLGALALAPHAAAGAQETAAQLLEQGISAYQEFRFDVAARLLRRALTFPTPSALPREERARALSYLAAVELFRDRRDSALAAFERLVILAPRYRPSDLIFPPPVLNEYERVRQATKVVEIVAPDSVDLRVGTDLFAPRLYGSSLHDVRASLVESDGDHVVSLYHGPLGDSLVLRWDGRDSTRAPAASGSYQLRVESHDDRDRVVRIAQLPLDLQLTRQDTLRHPPRPDSLLKPERIPLGPALQVLVAGAGLGGLAVGLPTVVGGASDASWTRFTVGAALGVAGIAAFWSRQPGRAIPENVASNRTVLGQWQRQREAVVRENRDRLRDVRLRIRTGPMTQIQREVR